jgi:Family of unknown function (DUF6325)
MANSTESSARDSSPPLDPGSPIRAMGPIDYLVIEFPGRQTGTGEALRMLLDLVDRGIIRVLELAFLRKERDGTVTHLQPSELAANGQPEFAAFDGASSGLLDRGDLKETAQILTPETIGAVFVYENTWAAPLATELNRGGAQLIANGRIPVQALVAALDAADAADAAATKS